MIANYHTHTPRCHHAVGSEEEYIACALERGLQELGFSDHAPQLFHGDYYSTFRMRPEELAGYVETLRGLREQYKDRIAIHIGLEMEYYPTIFRDTLDFVRQAGVEYLILGQHCLGDEMNGEFYSGGRHKDEAILAQYCRQVKEAMRTGAFSYVAHPDIIRYEGDDAIYVRYMEDLCREALRLDIPLEVNLLGWEERRHYPRRLFWETVAGMGNKVVLGCDAHRPEALSDTTPEQEAMEMIRELGLNLQDRVRLRPLG